MLTSKPGLGTRFPPEEAAQNDGGVASTIATVCVQVLVWPRQSVACQTRDTNCGQVPLVVVLRAVTSKFVPQQLSIAVGGVNVNGVPHITLIGLGHAMDGGGHWPARAASVTKSRRRTVARCFIT